MKATALRQARVLRERAKQSMAQHRLNKTTDTSSNGDSVTTSSSKDDDLSAAMAPPLKVQVPAKPKSSTKPKYLLKDIQAPKKVQSPESTKQDETKKVQENVSDDKDGTEKEEEKLSFQPGDRVFCLQKSSTSVWFPGRVIGFRRKKNEIEYEFKSDDNDEKRIVRSSSLLAVEEEEYQPSSDRSISVGTRVFALDIDAEDNFHWLLATISPYESSSSSVLVVYDGETEPQSTELVWCLKNQEDNEDEDDSESYLFDDTSSSSMDEEEEEALEKRFNTASMKLHKSGDDIVETNLTD